MRLTTLFPRIVLLAFNVNGAPMAPGVKSHSDIDMIDIGSDYTNPTEMATSNFGSVNFDNLMRKANCDGPNADRCRVATAWKAQRHCLVAIEGCWTSELREAQGQNWRTQSIEADNWCEREGQCSCVEKPNLRGNMTPPGRHKVISKFLSVELEKAGLLNLGKPEYPSSWPAVCPVSLRGACSNCICATNNRMPSECTVLVGSTNSKKDLSSHCRGTGKQEGCKCEHPDRGKYGDVVCDSPLGTALCKNICSCKPDMSFHWCWHQQLNDKQQNRWSSTESDSDSQQRAFIGADTWCREQGKCRCVPKRAGGPVIE